MNWNLAMAVLVGGGLGFLTGLASGQVVRVWRDSSTGVVYQRGGWSYVLVLLGLFAVRLMIYIVFQKMGIGISMALLNGTFIALAVSNYLGRTINVHMRAAALLSKPVSIYR